MPERTVRTDLQRDYRLAVKCLQRSY